MSESRITEYGLYPNIMGDISTSQYWADWDAANGYSARLTPRRISNYEARMYAKDLELFQGSNLHSEVQENGWYVVFSYGWYPIYGWSNETGGIGVLEPYSNTTKRHINQLGMHSVPLWTSGVMRWVLDQEPHTLPKFPKKTGKHYLNIEARIKIDTWRSPGQGRNGSLITRQDAYAETTEWFDVLQIPDTHHYYALLETQKATSTELPNSRSQKAMKWLGIHHYVDLRQAVHDACDMFGKTNRVRRQVDYRVTKCKNRSHEQ
jgi:hypothetical protein